MNEQEKQPKPFYKDRDDTLEDAGITPKQLRTWREAGLFVAELGPSTRKFTEADIANLKVLRQLIVGLGLPIQTVQQLVQDLPTTYQPYNITSSFTYLNLGTAKLVRPGTALRGMMEHRLGGAKHISVVEGWLLTLTLHYFTEINRIYGTADLYEAKRKELWEQIRRMDLAARAEDPEDAFEEDGDGSPIRRAPQFQPGISGDPDPTPELMDQLVRERSRRLAGVQHAQTRALREELGW